MGSVADVVITGGGGFLGSRLARELLAAGSLNVAGGGARPLSRITLIDRAPVPADLAADERVTAISGELDALLDPAAAETGPLAGAEVIFHLAAAVSGECEADFDLGLRANLRATEALLASCRALGTGPVVVFASSLAVFGASEEHPLPPVVDDHTLPAPQTSYGTQKLISEQLLADYTRKGFLNGRAVRLMTVSVRPGRPNAAATGFLSGIIREPLAGQRASCPVDPGTEVALASPPKAIAALLCAATSADAGLGRPHRGHHARAHRDGRGHGRGADPDRRPGGQRADRLDPRPGGGPDGVELARPGQRGPRHPAGPDPGPGLRLGHQDVPGRVPARRGPRVTRYACGDMMSTSHGTPNWSTHMPNSSPQACLSSGMVVVPLADSFSQ